MKAILISLAALVVVSLTGCRESPALVEMIPTDLNLNGEYYEAEPTEEDCLIWAEISDYTVEVYLRVNDVDHLCWQGTYKKPYGRPDRYSWVSTNTYLTCGAATYDKDSVKLFEYYDGELTFELDNMEKILIAGALPT